MRLLRLVACAGALALLAVIASAFWYGRAGPMPEGDAILVFGAGMTADGRLDAASRLRVARGVELWRAGAAPVILFSGGNGPPGGPVAAERMAAQALEAGVPEAAILREGRSHSTLQNAWFAARLLPEGARVVAVSEGFHMARCLLAARWAGLEISGHAVSTALRPGVASGGWMLVREVLAWGFNLGRIAAFAAAGWAGVTEEARVDWLR